MIPDRKTRYEANRDGPEASDSQYEMPYSVCHPGTVFFAQAIKLFINSLCQHRWFTKNVMMGSLLWGVAHTLTSIYATSVCCLC